MHRIDIVKVNLPNTSGIQIVSGPQQISTHELHQKVNCCENPCTSTSHRWFISSICHHLLVSHSLPVEKQIKIKHHSEALEKGTLLEDISCSSLSTNPHWRKTNKG